MAKRARHVVTENQRVLDAVEALKHDDLTKLGELMGQSHESMRDDFEITVPQIDYLVELAQLVIGKAGGARMTGGGFGGCIVALAPHDKVEEVRKIIADNYEKQTGLKRRFLRLHSLTRSESMLEKTASMHQMDSLINLFNSPIQMA